MSVSDDTTLRELRAHIRAHVRKGLICPACDQFAKVYRRCITSTMARALIALYKLSGDGRRFVHVNDFAELSGGGDLAKLALFGLIEAKGHVGKRDKSTSGRWRITVLGQAFVLGQVVVPYAAEVYARKLLGLDNKKQRSIFDALGKKFDRDQLMAAEATRLPRGRRP